jgi:asparagine synthase (glutamine-hydrolysing)
MCGIAGIYHLNGGKVELQSLKKMTDSISHRGPDGEGFWIHAAENLGFGHRRLSIIDLSDGGKQPMHYLENRYTIVFNGEIYNYVELKNELLKAGYRFHSESDTEVLLALYDCKKEECLNDLDGMFAFAIWDEQEKEMFCARDRFGEKPFHYFYNKQTFAFASEAKALFAAGFKKEFDLTRLQAYINHAANEYPVDTYFKDIIKLEQGNFLKIKNGTLTIKRYFNLEIETKFNYKNENDYAEHFDELFMTSIKRRLRSDVPVGTSLSGGLDSSSVVCYIHKALNGSINQKAFSARFYDHKHDEGKWIDIIKDKTKVQHYDVYPNPEDICNDINKMTWSHETPLGSTSNCAQFYVMQLAKKNNVTVILDGQGADEFLAGYQPYRQYSQWEHFYNFKFGKFLKERELHYKKYGKHLSLGYYFIPKTFFSKFLLPGNTDNRYFQSLKSKLRFDLKYNLPELLAYADRNAMIHSVETRLPFLFHELVNFVLACPTRLIFNNATTKIILRKAISGTVPDEIANRQDKLNYNPRQELWLHYFETNDKYQLQKFSLQKGPNYWRNFATSKFLEVYS